MRVHQKTHFSSSTKEGRVLERVETGLGHHDEYLNAINNHREHRLTRCLTRKQTLSSSLCGCQWSVGRFQMDPEARLWIN